MIDKESDLLEPLRSCADLIVDTSEMSVHALAEMLRTRLSKANAKRELSISIESFGFKHGNIPIDADYVFDVRFRPTRTGIQNCAPMTA